MSTYGNYFVVYIKEIKILTIGHMVMSCYTRLRVLSKYRMKNVCTRYDLGQNLSMFLSIKLLYDSKLRWRIWSRIFPAGAFTTA